MPTLFSCAGMWHDLAAALQLCAEQEALRDECYCQVVKQLTDRASSEQCVPVPLPVPLGTQPGLLLPGLAPPIFSSQSSPHSVDKAYRLKLRGLRPATPALGASMPPCKMIAITCESRYWWQVPETVQAGLSYRVSSTWKGVQAWLAPGVVRK